MTGWRATGAWAIFCVAAALSAYNVVRGIARTREPGALGDLRTRSAEYELFRQGVYPNGVLAGRRGVRYTVYPPYALPMFAAFFEPGGFRQGAFVVGTGSLVSLVVIGWYGARALRFAGPGLAATGACAASAIAGVIGCLWVGQFSLVCVALLVGQLVCVERGRSAAAGLCWALAMLKPQIALPFAMLFLPRRQWRGLVVGGVTLAALGLLACCWTGLSPLRLVHYWVFRESLAWTGREGTLGPGKVATVLGLRPRDMQLAVVGTFACVAAAGWWFAGRRLARADLLPLAGACGLIGELLFYHRAYDHVMLAPAVIAVLAEVAARPSVTSAALAVLVPASVWLPGRFIDVAPLAGLGQAAIWATAAVVLVVWACRVSPHRPDAAAMHPAG